MTDSERHDPNKIDFVVGPPTDSHDDEALDVLDTSPPGQIDRRLWVALAVAALVVVGLAAALRGNGSSNPTSMPSESSSVAPTDPVIPTFANRSPAPLQTVILTPVTLDANLCVAHRNCFRVPTPKAAQTRVRAAIRHAFGGVSRLHIRDSAIALDDPPRMSLFAREITATTPRGKVIVQAAAVNPDSTLNIPLAGDNSLGTQTETAGYVLGGSVGARKGIDPLTLSGRLDRLMGDARLVAKS